ncbi:MAG: DUF72 domain-containing protein [Candidatus Krumholzibacteria bacterium]|nr:DUF72 domain-containing protein [Candidatus Krumholzibacteria bacterium]
MKLYVGTSGYSYKEWKGNFYPDTIAAQDMLGFYGTRLPAVEINNTFYRLPRESMLQTWAAQVPEDFRFAIKASRRITHIKRLKNAADETEYLLRTTATLRNRLGVILFQLPPNLSKDVSRLQGFLDLLPLGTRAAFEFRHPSWFDDEIYKCLRTEDCAICVADSDERPSSPLLGTASWGYLRLRKPRYTKSELVRWLAQIQEQEWKDAFIFFKHEEDGAGPKMAAKLIGLAKSV